MYNGRAASVARRHRVIARDLPRPSYGPSPRDWMFFLMLLFLIGFVASRWGDYSECALPMATYLVVAYSTILIFRIFHFSITHFLTSGDPEVDCTARVLPKMLIWIHIWIIWLAMAALAICGCVLYNRDRPCLPSSMGGGGFILTIALLFIYVFQHAFVLSRTIRLDLEAMRLVDQIAGEEQSHTCTYLPSILFNLHVSILRELEARLDTVNNMGNIIVVQPAPLMIQPDEILRIHVMQQQLRAAAVANAGLTQEQIESIPKRCLTDSERSNEMCSICLVEFAQLPPIAHPHSYESTAAADNAAPLGSTPDNEPEISVNGNSSRIYSSDPIWIRSLPCRHIHHQACIDAWLKEKASCPNCRVACLSPSPLPTQASASSSPPAAASIEMQPLHQQQPPPHDFTHRIDMERGDHNRASLSSSLRSEHLDDSPHREHM